MGYLAFMFQKVILLLAGVMRCGAAEATGLGFVCFVFINPCVLSANRVDNGLFLYLKIHNPPSPTGLPVLSPAFNTERG